MERPGVAAEQQGELSRVQERPGASGRPVCAGEQQRLQHGDRAGRSLGVEALGGEAQHLRLRVLVCVVVADVRVVVQPAQRGARQGSPAWQVLRFQAGEQFRDLPAIGKVQHRPVEEPLQVSFLSGQQRVEAPQGLPGSSAGVSFVVAVAGSMPQSARRPGDARLALRPVQPASRHVSHEARAAAAVPVRVCTFRICSGRRCRRPGSGRACQRLHAGVRAASPAALDRALASAGRRRASTRTASPSSRLLSQCASLPPGLT